MIDIGTGLILLFMAFLIYLRKKKSRNNSNEETCVSLQCIICGDTYFTSTPGYHELCEICGGPLEKD